MNMRIKYGLELDIAKQRHIGFKPHCGQHKYSIIVQTLLFIYNIIMGMNINLLYE